MWLRTMSSGRAALICPWTFTLTPKVRARIQQQRRPTAAGSHPGKPHRANSAAPPLAIAIAENSLAAESAEPHGVRGMVAVLMAARPELGFTRLSDMARSPDADRGHSDGYSVRRSDRSSPLRRRPW